MAVDWMIYFGSILDSSYPFVKFNVEIRRTYETNSKGNLRMLTTVMSLVPKIWVQSTLSLTSDGSKKTGSVSSLWICLDHKIETSGTGLCWIG